jgi:hypothetical protein
MDTVGTTYTLDASTCRPKMRRPFCTMSGTMFCTTVCLCLNNSLNTRTLNPNAHFPPPCDPPMSPLALLDLAAQVSSRVARLQSSRTCISIWTVCLLVRATAGLHRGPPCSVPVLPCPRRRVLVAPLLLSCPLCSLPFYASTMNPKATRADPSISMARNCTQQWTRPPCCPCRQYCPRRR